MSVRNNLYPFCSADSRLRRRSCFGDAQYAGAMIEGIGRLPVLYIDNGGVWRGVHLRRAEREELDAELRDGWTVL